MDVGGGEAQEAEPSVEQSVPPEIVLDQAVAVGASVEFDAEPLVPVVEIRLLSCRATRYIRRRRTLLAAMDTCIRRRITLSATVESCESPADVRYPRVRVTAPVGGL